MSRRIDPLGLPAVSEWVGSLVPQPGWMSFLTHRVGLDATVVVARLIWPRFVEIDGCVIIDGLRTESEVRSWLGSTQGDIPRTEAILSTLRLWDVFPNDSPSDVEEAALSEVLHILETVWPKALSTEFPDRRFRVQVSDGDDGYGPTVWFSSESRSA